MCRVFALVASRRSAFAPPNARLRTSLNAAVPFPRHLSKNDFGGTSTSQKVMVRTAIAGYGPPFAIVTGMGGLAEAAILPAMNLPTGFHINSSMAISIGR